MQTVDIEDDDGFKTVWPWPDDKTMIANAEFVDLYIIQHNQLRVEWLRKQGKE